jgi:hypothetical protein
VFAGSAARYAALAGAFVLGVALVAGGVRLLPLFFAARVPMRLLPVLARAVLGVAFETALFVAPPIGWALAASRLVERGEARALFAIGVRPAGIVVEAWPAAAGLAGAAALAAALWGTEASAPGRAVRELIAEARTACTSSVPPAVVDVPVLAASWVCLAGEPPRLVGAAPAGRAGAFTATSLGVTDDLRAFEATDFDLLVPASDALPEVRVHARDASLRGLAPIGRASNLRPWLRAILLAASAAMLAAVAGGIALALAVRSRAIALALGAVGPLASLLVFSALERAPSPAVAYAAVPAAGLGALLLAAGVLTYARGSGGWV